jgi:hypothetical protein
VSATDDDEKGTKPSGRVRHDASGRAVWEWAVESGRHAIESTSRLLKRLDMSGLGLLDEEQEKKKKEEEERRIAREEGVNPYGHKAPDPVKRQIPTFGGKSESDPLAGVRRSFNPYDKGAPPKRGAAPPAARSAAPRSTPPQPARPPTKPGLLSRLLGRKY